MDCRTTAVHKFRTGLEYKQFYVILTKEQSVLTKVMNSFEKEKMPIQYSALVFIVLYFHDYELTLEIYESDHCNRDVGFEIGRQKAIEERLGCEFIKINPDKENSYY